MNVAFFLAYSVQDSHISIFWCVSDQWQYFPEIKGTKLPSASFQRSCVNSFKELKTSQTWWRERHDETGASGDGAGLWREKNWQTLAYAQILFFKLIGEQKERALKEILTKYFIQQDDDFWYLKKAPRLLHLCSLVLFNALRYNFYWKTTGDSANWNIHNFKSERDFKPRGWNRVAQRGDLFEIYRRCAQKRD